MPTLLLTGANRGIGLEFARQYAGEGWRVIAACRDPAGAEALRALKGKVELHALDVADFAAVERLGKELQRETIDLLIANAGISGPREIAMAQIDADAWAQVFRVNAMAPLALAGAFHQQLARGAGKAVAISSRMGSIAENPGGRVVYRSSKTALNMVWSCLAKENPGLIAVVLHPGWVRTDMGGEAAPVLPADSVAGMRQVIAKLTKADSGRFFDYTGAELPW
ncbi:MAG: SDR family oxidoreductase [Alphaproteobacteria bacterium]|nr:SDR family oxidoreductase [Alphaproteobacteria bacterium]